MSRPSVGPLLMVLITTVIAAASAPTQLHAAEQAGATARWIAARAVNDINVVDDGYELLHPRHRATFLTNGIRVSPRGGSPAWRWTLARVGPAETGDSLVEATGVHPEHPDTLVVRYDRLALDEEYRLGAASIEQRFILHVPPPLDGRDLVLEGSVTCDGDFRPEPGRWEWRGDGGLVWLGPAVVLDAEGRVLPSRFEVTATATRLVVDRAALAEAKYPVTIDPEIGANDQRISSMGPNGDPDYDAYYPAVAYNSIDNEYLVVWTGDDTIGGVVEGEFEIFGQLLSADGSMIITNDFRISDVGGTGNPLYGTGKPDVAYDSGFNRYLVVWWANDPVDGVVQGENEIWGQVLDADGGSLYVNDFRISFNGGSGDPDYDARFPAVVYNPHTYEYLVVWEADDTIQGMVDDEREIFAQRLSSNGTLIGPNLRMSDMGGSGNANYNAFEPDVAYDGDDFEYCIVWYGDDNTGGLVNNEFEIFGQLIDETGGGVGPNDFRLSDMGGTGDPAYAAYSPSVAYNPAANEYFVVWYGDDNVGGLVNGESEVFSQRFTPDIVGVGPNDYRLSDVGGVGNPDYDVTSGPEVAYNPALNRYLVVWAGEDNIGGMVDGEEEVFAQALTWDIHGVGPNDERISDVGGIGETTYAAQWPVVAANSANGQFLVAWYGDDNVGSLVPGEYEIFIQRMYMAEIFADGFESGDTSRWSEVVP
jgi:hypothetical protein